jgi:HEPN domain-containing protein
LSTPEHREVAGLLLQKAREDLSAAQALIATEDQADHVIGFHLQQAVEKALKSVLADRAVEIPRTHDLGYLVELVDPPENTFRRIGRILAAGNEPHRSGPEDRD